MTSLPQEINNPETPLYPIGVVAELLNVTDQTLRVYEKSGIIKPLRRNRDRYYSANDIVWLKCIRRFMKQEGINLKGIGKLMQFVPCFEISPCNDCCECTAYLKRGIAGKCPAKSGDSPAKRRKRRS
ncbi:MAG: MerR family transcriptional regulator [Terriglobia bacterium]